MKTVFIITALTSIFMYAMEQESIIEAQRTRSMSHIERQYKVIAFVGKAERFIRKKTPINKDTFSDFFNMTEPSLKELENTGFPVTASELTLLKNRLLQLKQENNPKINQRITQFLATIQALVVEAQGSTAFVEEFLEFM